MADAATATQETKPDAGQQTTDTTQQEGTQPVNGGEQPTSGAAPQDTGSLLDMADDEGGDDGKVTTPADWPEDWRQKMAGEDEKLLKQLERFASPLKMFESYRALQQRVSSGEYKKEVPFPEQGTPEEQAAWYEERGLPKDPSGYQPPKIDGHEWTDADKPELETLFGMLHKAQVPQAGVDAVLGYYAQKQQELAESQAEAQKAFKQEAEDVLRAEFGNEFRPHLNVYKRVLEDKEVFPGEAGEWLANATFNGQRLINHPDIAKALISIGLDKYGAGGLIPGDAMQKLNSREEEIKKVMNTDFERYVREGMDKEYAEILAKKGGGRSR